MWKNLILICQKANVFTCFRLMAAKQWWQYFDTAQAWHNTPNLFRRCSWNNFLSCIFGILSSVIIWEYSSWANISKAWLKHGIQSLVGLMVLEFQWWSMTSWLAMCLKLSVQKRRKIPLDLKIVSKSLFHRFLKVFEGQEAGHFETGILQGISNWNNFFGQLVIFLKRLHYLLL